MAGFIDFDDLKKNVSFEQAIGLLELTLKRSGKQWRGACPACKGADRSLVVTEGAGAYCFSASKGGDVIWLVSHVMGSDVKSAAKLLAGSINSPTVPQEQPSGGEAKGGFTPLKDLEFGHEAVIALGLDPHEAKQLGIGYCSKGVMRGHVVVPVYLPDGRLTGYVGVQDMKLPPSWHCIETKVVTLDSKRRA